jgi:hypothetical protein
MSKFKSRRGRDSWNLFKYPVCVIDIDMSSLSIIRAQMVLHHSTQMAGGSLLLRDSQMRLRRRELIYVVVKDLVTLLLECEFSRLSLTATGASRAGNPPQVEQFVIPPFPPPPQGSNI